jgi:prolyl 4-hydroxylase
LGANCTVVIHQFENFITAGLAKQLIDEGEKFFTPATVLGPLNNRYRVADAMFIDKTNPLVTGLLDDISRITNLPVEHQEAPQVVRYTKGGEYKTHHDFFHLNQAYSEEVLSRGGQRVKTALIYLNDNFTGGGTSFPKLNLIIKPQKQKLVTWDNVNPDGSLNVDSLHAGLPVKKGIKYILVTWIRERVFV